MSSLVDKSVNHEQVPVSISLDKWADAGFEWSGKVAADEFERLRPLLNVEHQPTQITVSLVLSKLDNVLYLTFELVGSIWLTCQRCLQPVAIDLTGQYQIALLEDESQASLLAEDRDFLLLDEVVSESSAQRQSAQLPLLRLIEDEILLKAPLAPKHEDCDMVVEQVGQIPEEKENPFAALAALKEQL